MHIAIITQMRYNNKCKGDTNLNKIQRGNKNE